MIKINIIENKEKSKNIKKVSSNVIFESHYYIFYFIQDLQKTNSEK